MTLMKDLRRTKPSIEFAQALALGFLLSGLGACAANDGSNPVARSKGALDQTIADWPDVSKKAAQDMAAKYGQPNGVAPDRLIWNKKGPWQEIILSRDEVPHQFPMKHTDVLEQVINYKVPPDKFDELAQYDGSVIVERTKGTMSARCDKEPMNFLALNLAHDIVTGKRSVEEARDFYAKTAVAFMKGEKHPYTQKLHFELPRGNTADQDQPASQ